MSALTIKTNIVMKPGLPVSVKSAYKIGRRKRFLTIEGSDAIVHMDREGAKQFLTVLDGFKDDTSKFCKQLREYLRTQLT